MAAQAESDGPSAGLKLLPRFRKHWAERSQQRCGEGEEGKGGGGQHAAEEGLPVVGADSGGEQRQEIVLQETLSKKLVEQTAWNQGSQGAFEPGVLDGNVHVCCCYVLF